MKRKLLFLLLFFYAATLTAQQSLNPLQTLNQVKQNFFIPNHGQWNPEVKYLARIGGMNAWITNSGIVYDYYRIKKNFDDTKTLKMDPQQNRDYESKNTIVEGDVVRMQLVNEASNITGVGNNQKEGYYNYFIGNDKSKWASKVPLYDNIELKGVYKDINVKYYYDNGQLRYDYKAQPGADISQIKFKFDGQQGMSVNANGELVLKTSIGEVTNGKIYAYQMDGGSQKEVPCKFEQGQDGSIGLKANSYDLKKELIIDPLVYSTFIGGNNYDQGNSIAIDSSGNSYLTGETSSANFPATVGAYQDTLEKNLDVFVTKLNSSGSGLVYSTFIGGIGNDIGGSIALDASRNTYITGMSMSSNFPTSNNAYQRVLGSIDGNVFVTKLNATGTALVYSTFIGGNNQDAGKSIALDSNGNAYITGQTSSANFPTTSGAYQTIIGSTKAGNSNAFVTKLNSSGSSLIYSTFIGGNNGDGGASIKIDASGNAYITGLTYSSNFPITSGAFQSTLGSVNGGNAFVTKINPTGSSLVYSTFIGGSNQDAGASIAIDLSGNAYITGQTSSQNFPITSGAFQTSWGGNLNYDVFVTKLNPLGSALIYSTFIGGSSNDGGSSIAIDSSGNAYITGNTSSANYPVTMGVYQDTLGGSNGNAFVTKINPTGSSLVYSTFIGGNHQDQGESIAIDEDGNTYLTGWTSSANFPITNSAYQVNFGGLFDAFVTKLNLSPTTFVDPGTLSFPNKFELMQNYPNPFNPSTKIKYILPFSSNVKIEVYNILGEKIKELVNEQKNTGNYEVNFNTNGLASGVYFYMIEAKSIDGKNEFRDTKKMILLK